MTTKERVKEINGYVEKWQELLLLDQWDVFVNLHAANKEANPSTLADIVSREQYLEANMEVYPLLWETHDKNYREGTIVHELSHIVTSPLERVVERLLDGQHVTRAQYLDALERVTEHVARVAVRLHKKR